MSGGTLSMWVVYDHPRDVPESYVARRWEVGPGEVATDDVVAFDDIDKLRLYFQAQGLVKLMRQQDDQPHIMEVWL
jgi:hypothetical protein